MSANIEEGWEPCEPPKPRKKRVSNNPKKPWKRESIIKLAGDFLDSGDKCWVKHYAPTYDGKNWSKKAEGDAVYMRMAVPKGAITITMRGCDLYMIANEDSDKVDE